MSQNSAKQAANAGAPRSSVRSSSKVLGTSSETTSSVNAKANVASLKPSSRVTSRLGQSALSWDIRVILQKVQGAGCRVRRRFRVRGSGCWVLGSGFRVLGFRGSGSGFNGHGSALYTVYSLPGGFCALYAEVAELA